MALQPGTQCVHISRATQAWHQPSARNASPVGVSLGASKSELIHTTLYAEHPSLCQLRTLGHAEPMLAGWAAAPGQASHAALPAGEEKGNKCQ